MASRLLSLARRRWVQVLVGVLLVFRMVLPEIVRRIAERQASDTLHARVHIGDVDLALLRAGVTLEDVWVRPADGTPETDAQVPALVAWQRLAVRLRWLPLLWKTIQLQTIEIDGLRIALDRLKDGNINLLALAPKPSEPEGEATPTEKSSGWTFGIDRIALRDGGVRFRDLIFPDAEPIEIVVPFVDVTDVQLAPGLYGRPARIRVKLGVDEGTVGLAARLGITEDLGLRVDATIKVARLPVKRTRLYLADLGWSDLRGALSAAVRYRRLPGVREEIRGDLALEDVYVFVGGIKDPTLAWKRLAVHVDPLELVSRRAHVTSVSLIEPRVLVRLSGGDTLPFLAAVPGAAAKTEAAPANPAAPAPPWTWSVDALRLTGGHVQLAAGEQGLDVGVGVRATNIAMDRVATVEAQLAADGGTVTANGEVALAPVGVNAQVHVDQLPLPAMVTMGAGLPPALLQTGTLTSALTVGLGGLAPEKGGLVLKGEISLADLWIASGDGREFAVGGKRMVAGLDDVRVPSVLPVDADAARKAPIRAGLGTLTLEQPYALVTRTPTGIALPVLSSASSTPEQTPPASTPPAPATAPGFELSLATLKVTGGRVLLSDRTVTPYYWGGLVGLEVDAQQLRLPGPALGRLRVRADSATKGKLELRASSYPSGGPIEFRVDDVALMPFNPLATGNSPYSITRGTLSAATTGTLARSKFDTTTSVTLHDFDVGGAEGDSLFEQQFGLPLTLALALLRDLDGDIALDVPVSADEGGTSVGVGTVIAGALRRALLGALTSPLKLLGSVVSSGEKVETFSPAPLGFRLGRAELAPGSEEQVQQIALFVSSRPGIAVGLEAIVTPRDIRWIAEQALAHDLGRSRVLGAVGNVASGGARGRILAALTARAADQDIPLDEADGKTLDEWLAKRPAPDAAELTRLADARAARVAGLLESSYGLAGARVTRKPERTGGDADSPGVAFHFEAVAH